ncbi:hypothetical protein DPMN_170751 [Dreissena polymorpha]|uniref:Uncharacterized protein n=1 Tax=Dreissena polymorpha TaxID=45954 RepID=A0A9D4DYF2_DREPO|nr:hypothetical protein DPMN_170751 [Dreissena polymorpha]
MGENETTTAYISSVRQRPPSAFSGVILAQSSSLEVLQEGFLWVNNRCCHDQVVFVGLEIHVGDAEQLADTPVLKGLYLSFCLRTKRSSSPTVGWKVLTSLFLVSVGAD